MLVRICLDEEVMHKPSTGLSNWLAAHKRLIQVWRTQGILVMPYDKDEAASKFLLGDDLPQSIRIQWKEALRRCRYIKADEIDGAMKDDGVDIAKYAGLIDELCLEEMKAELVFNLPPDETSIIMPEYNVEVCRFENIDQTDYFQKAQQLASSYIEQGEPLSQVWNQRFVLLAKHSKHVAIIDRYALQDGDGINGLRQLMINLDRDGKGASLAVFASVEKGQSADELSERIRRIYHEMSRGGLRSVKAVLAQSAYFSHESHGRFVRFDNSVCEIDTGISVFAGQNGKVGRRTQFAYKVKSEIHQKIESALCRSPGVEEYEF